MLTGVPLEALPWRSDGVVPQVYTTTEVGDAQFTFNQADAWGDIDPEDRTIDDWSQVLPEGYEFVEHRGDIPQDRPVGIVLYNPVTGWTHVVAQEDGVIYDPSPAMEYPHTNHQFYLDSGAQPVLSFSIEKVTDDVTKS
jgi:hypothetical protein